MKKELDLHSLDFNSNKSLRFTENAMTRLVMKTMVPVAGAITAASIAASFYFSNPSYMVGILIALGGGFCSGFLLDGLYYRKKILRFARSKNISLSRTEKRRLLKMMKKCSSDEISFGENDNLEVSTVWNGDNVIVQAVVTQKDDFNEAFINALTINDDELVTYFDQDRGVTLPNETPFQKGINGRVAQLNKLVVDHSKGTYVPYSAEAQGDNFHFSFHVGGNFDKPFEGIVAACDKDLMERFDAQYSGK